MNRLSRRILTTNILQIAINRNIIRSASLLTCADSNSLLSPISQYIDFHQIRHKSSKGKAKGDDEESYNDDEFLNKDSKVVKFSTGSMRTDLVLKSALGVSRNQIEQQFYESKIRINGKKIMKKSLSVKVGDEIDIVKGVSPKNSDHLYVSRVEILDAVASGEDSITLTVRRFKSLLIENYEVDAYKSNSESA